LIRLLHVVGNVTGGFTDDDQIADTALSVLASVLNCSRVVPALNSWISAMAARMSSIRRRHFLDDTHDLGQDSVTNARFQTLRRAKIDSATKQILQVVLEFQEPEHPDGRAVTTRERNRPARPSRRRLVNTG